MRRPRFLRKLINWKQVGPHPVRKFLIMAAMVVLVVCLLAMYLPLWAKYHPQIVAYGFISFGVTFLIAWVSGLLYGIISTIYGYRKYPALWKHSINSSWASRYRKGRRIRQLNDPFLTRLGNLWSNFGLTCFFIWLVQLVIVSVILIKKGY